MKISIAVAARNMELISRAVAGQYISIPWNRKKFDFVERTITGIADD